MSKHTVLIVLLSSFILGGCSLTPSKEQAASDTNSPAPSVVVSDQVTPLSSSSDEASIEVDLENTIILDEDFSDIQ